MTTQQTATPPLNLDHAIDLADDLIRELAEHVGDLGGINAVVLRWFDVLDAQGLSAVALAVVQTIFAECLTVTDPSDWPTNGVAFEQEEES